MAELLKEIGERIQHSGHYNQIHWLFVSLFLCIHSSRSSFLSVSLVFEFSHSTGQHVSCYALKLLRTASCDFVWLGKLFSACFVYGSVRCIHWGLSILSMAFDPVSTVLVALGLSLLGWF